MGGGAFNKHKWAGEVQPNKPWGSGWIRSSSLWSQDHKSRTQPELQELRHLVHEKGNGITYVRGKCFSLALSAHIIGTKDQPSLPAFQLHSDARCVITHIISQTCDFILWQDKVVYITGEWDLWVSISIYDIGNAAYHTADNSPLNSVWGSLVNYSWNIDMYPWIIVYRNGIHICIYYLYIECRMGHVSKQIKQFSKSPVRVNSHAADLLRLKTQPRPWLHQFSIWLLGKKSGHIFRDNPVYLILFYFFDTKPCWQYHWLMLVS